MIKWLNKSGQEVETNDNPANIKAAEKAGWTLASEAEASEAEADAKAEASAQMEIETSKDEPKIKGKK